MHSAWLLVTSLQGGTFQLPRPTSHFTERVSGEDNAVGSVCLPVRLFPTHLLN